MKKFFGFGKSKEPAKPVITPVVQTKMDNYKG
jgi:hypothetical protein